MVFGKVLLIILILIAIAVAIAMRMHRWRVRRDERRAAERAEIERLLRDD
ncbi:hypothetical protein JD276_05580 [Leucobacter sp. CSA1]|uniref:Uncharacterized protein n=1 Tax=Leucobacter chromiisoli TaxID=2796471 RepID=A0A934UV23_9MICO|nr:hypothetical protein [Leucobacter chromiisoli]MBK0418502.1 hypothetical protein [Leucobacter chromiisoli]